MPLPITGKAHGAPASAPFTWFVYGSSLDPAAFGEWAASHGYVVPPLTGARPGRLMNFKLAFDVASRHWNGPVASLAEAPGHFVEGLLVPMPGEARGLVEHKEGAVSGLYVACEVVVAPVGGGLPVAALAWRAAPGKRLPKEGRPAAAYLEVLLAGARARGLSAEWQAKLAAMGR